MLSVTDIARICHEANRAYCSTLGDDSQPTWEEAPQWQKDSATKGVIFHQVSLANGETPSPSASHDSWLKEKADAGWTYGPIKDADKKEHPCFVPYDQLPVEQRVKDYLFGAIAYCLSSKHS